MDKNLKGQLGDVINAKAAAAGIENFLDMVADETICDTEEEVFEFITGKNHPALSMPDMF
jgi:acetyl-CoA synthase